MEKYKDPYVTKLFLDYQDVPTEYKYMVIKKDCCQKLGGKREAENRMKYLHSDTETFIVAFYNAVGEFSKTIKKNLFKKYCEDLARSEHYELLKSEMFFEFFPNLSGIYLQDKKEFTKFVTEREISKGWLDKIL